jgi:antitoxin HicB
MLVYRISLEPDDDTLLVTCPLLPEVTTYGETREAALGLAVDAIEEALAARVAHREDIPLEDEEALAHGVSRDHGDGCAIVRVRLQSTLKTALYLACRGRGVTRADLARRLGWHREQVDRLFRFDHATRLDQFDAAVAGRGQEIDLALRAA